MEKRNLLKWDKTKLKYVLLLGGGLVIFIMVVNWFSNGGPPVQGGSGDILPIHIQKVKPSDGEAIMDLKGVCANFIFQEGEGIGDNPLSKIKFYFDGFDVTSQIDGLVALDKPPSWGTLCYKSTSGTFSRGWHTAKIVYRDVTGQEFDYLWRFLVKR